MRYFVILCCVLLATSLNAQELTANGKPNRFIAYGISNQINSSYHEINPVLSSDEQTLYFSIIDHPENHYGDYRSQDIWFSNKQEDGSWSKPERVDAPFNDNRFNSVYSITGSGDLLIAGVYAKNGRYKGRGLSKVTKTENGWSQPERLKIPSLSRGDQGLASSMFLNKEGNMLLMAYSSSWLKASTRKIKYSIKKNNGKWKKPKVIKNKELSKKFHSIEAPYLSDDGLILYFSAYRRSGGEYYKNDIYKMTRYNNTSKIWENPIKLSDTVNTDDWENYYKRFNNNVWAIFNRAAIGDDSDIMIVKLYEPKPYVDLKGVVLLDGKPLKDKFEIMINNQIVDSVRINKNTSSYAVQLPLGVRYEVQAVAEEMEAKIEVIDAIGELEYLPMEKNLELSLLPFLDLSGSVTLYDQPLKEPFKVLVNGVEIDSLITDNIEGKYSVRLPLGRSYELEVRASNYIPQKVTVDVRNEQRQIRVVQPLKLTTIPYVDIQGNMLDLQGNVSIPLNASPKLMVNGQVMDSISTSGSKYKIRLPWGQKYLLQIQATEYNPEVVIIDLVNVNNYQSITQDLYARVLEKFASVNGKVINMKTGIPINVDYYIEVNGSRSTNSTVDNATKIYEAKLSLGRKVTLTAKAKNYFPISEVIDLTAETESLKMYKDLQMMPLEVGEKILLNNIFFETASTNLKDESFADIDRVVDLLRSVPTLKIEIGGYTDSSGKDAYNLGLSNSRAKSVADYIQSKGIDIERVQHKGYGEASPVASNLTPEGRAKNRRVEFIVLEQ